MHFKFGQHSENEHLGSQVKCALEYLKPRNTDHGNEYINYLNDSGVFQNSIRYEITWTKLRKKVRHIYGSLIWVIIKYLFLIFYTHTCTYAIN